MVTKEVPQIYQEFLIYQLMDYNEMIYFGDSVKIEDELEGKVVGIESEEGDLPGLDDLSYIVEIDGKTMYKSRLELKRISQTLDNKELEAEFRKHLEEDNST